jgi:hypothetical protein
LEHLFSPVFSMLGISIRAGNKVSESTIEVEMPEHGKHLLMILGKRMIVVSKRYMLRTCQAVMNRIDAKVGGHDRSVVEQAHGLEPDIVFLWTQFPERVDIKNLVTQGARRVEDTQAAVRKCQDIGNPDKTLSLFNFLLEPWRSQQSSLPELRDNALFIEPEFARPVAHHSLGKTGMLLPQVLQHIAFPL